MSWLSDAEINTDRNLRLQYTAGSELNLDEGLVIYQELIANRSFPANLFSGTDSLTEGLKRAMARRK